MRIYNIMSLKKKKKKLLDQDFLTKPGIDEELDQEASLRLLECRGGEQTGPGVDEQRREMIR